MDNGNSLPAEQDDCGGLNVSTCNRGKGVRNFCNHHSGSVVQLGA
jgi:hypothetical protein